jgi:branched-chain amino acid transport system substrate-binding protein
MWPSFLISILVLFADNPAPYLDFSKSGAGFYGAGRELPEPTGMKSVRIGVLGPEKSPDGLQQRMAIKIALEEANDRGGYVSSSRRNSRPESDGAHASDNGIQPERSRGIPYELVYRPDDGPWGMTANQVVKFAYEDQVWAIIGGLDGQHTHVAELVVAKAWVPVISPAAIDSTVEYANVPWVFRVVPSDSRQAEILLKFAQKRHYQQLAVLSENQREAYSGIKRLKECSGHLRFPLASHMEYSALRPEEVIPRLRNVPADAFIIWGGQESTLILLQAMRQAGITLPVLAPSTVATPEMARKAPQSGELVVAAPCDLSRENSALANFNGKFEQLAGQPASWMAWFCYDVARLVIHSIEKAGLNRARIRDELSSSSFQGLTGTISFNQLGGNEAQPVLMSLNQGRWVRVE